MAQVFLHSPADAAWTAQLLEAPWYSLSEAGRRMEIRAATRPAPAPALLQRPSAAGPPQWLCCAAPEGCAVRVNGDPVLGFRILAHRDVVQIGGANMVFSAETAARIENYDGPPAARCPRCRQHLAPGAAVVRCPGCGTVHHATAELPCWTYGPRCAVCRQITELGADVSWSPDEL